jgi:tetratricopeptide (TPR) repeat protein
LKKAEEVASVLKKDIEEKDQTLMDEYWNAVGWIEWSKGNLEASLANFEKLAEDLPYPYPFGYFYIPNFDAHFYLSKAYLESGRLGEAVAELEKVLSRYDDNRALCAFWAVKAYYLLGLAYEKSGWNKKAIEKYEEFLEIWKDADPRIHEVEDAKKRLARLRAES